MAYTREQFAFNVVTNSTCTLIELIMLFGAKTAEKRSDLLFLLIEKTFYIAPLVWVIMALGLLPYASCYLGLDGYEPDRKMRALLNNPINATLTLNMIVSTVCWYNNLGAAKSLAWAFFGGLCQAPLDSLVEKARINWAAFRAQNQEAEPDLEQQALVNN